MWGKGQSDWEVADKVLEEALCASEGDSDQAACFEARAAEVAKEAKLVQTICRSSSRLQLAFLFKSLGHHVREELSASQSSNHDDVVTHTLFMVD